MEGNAMRQLVQSLLAAEAEAKAIVAAAAQEADRIVAEARANSRADLEQAVRDARDEAARMVDATMVTAEAEKKEQLAKRIAGFEACMQPDEAWHEDAVAAVIRCVSG